jgi:hypothetical protein
MTQQYGPPPIPQPVLGYSTIGCPKCGNPSSRPVTFTWWGGLLGPKILHHVKCLGCGYAYNGKTGRPNTNGIILYTVIGALIGLVLLAMFIWARF